jgi:hypothetical protein
MRTRAACSAATGAARSTTSGARPRGRPGRHAVEGDRRARRLRRRQPQPDRVPVPPRAAVPVLDVAPAGGGRRCLAALDVLRRSRSSSSGCGTTPASSRRASQGSASTPGSARARSRRSSWATGEGDELSDRLFEEGVFAQGIAFPTVARDKARVRTIVTATHTREDLQFALDGSSRGVSTRTATPGCPGGRRLPLRVRAFFVAFTLKLPPARRVLYIGALVIALIGLIGSSAASAPSRSPWGCRSSGSPCSCRSGPTAPSRSSSASSC